MRPSTTTMKPSGSIRPVRAGMTAAVWHTRNPGSRMLIGEAVPVTAELAGEHPLAEPVGADNAVTSRDLRILVDQAAEPVASSDAEVVVGRRGGDLGVGWCLAEGPMRPVSVVVIDVLAEDVVQMSPAGDQDAVGALAPRAGDP